MRFELFFPESVHPGPITGRMFLIATRSEKSEPRLQLFDVPFFAADVKGLKAGESAVIDVATPGFPLRSLAELPPGDYYVQGLLNIYTEFHRSDGHIIWAHMDQWEGQDVARSPRNLISGVKTVNFDPQCGCKLKLELNKTIPPIEVPPDTEWVKRIKFQSQLLSRFWGQPIYLGATILLPRGYNAHPKLHYPVVYVQGHFSHDAPFGFKTEPDPPETKSCARRREECNGRRLNMLEPPLDVDFNGSQYNVESGYEFYQSWISDDFPRVIAVTFQHPTPYFDDSYGINSANAGPYGDALMGELIPAVEERVRVIRQPYARVLTGCSTGGWSSLALQAYYPDSFGGAWIFCPDPVDFRRYYGGVSLYEDQNAFVVSPGNEWFSAERHCFRSPTGQVRFSNREFSRLTSMTGPQDPGYAWVNYTPVGSDGYPRPVWGLATGQIDREVVDYMKTHDYDLREYLERNWSQIGPQLAGKLYLYCGDEDGGYFNLAVYLLEDFLANTQKPYYDGAFHYGRPLKGHGWQPMTNAELVRTMAARVAEHAPAHLEANARSRN